MNDPRSESFRSAATIAGGEVERPSPNIDAVVVAAKRFRGVGVPAAKELRGYKSRIVAEV
jgi:hypothetical protein